MRGRIKLAGIVAVFLVVALGIGLALRLADVPASADVKDGETAYAEGWEWLEDAEKTVTIQGMPYGVLENGETYGVSSPTYVNEEGNIDSYEPDWQQVYADDGTTIGWLHMADLMEIHWPESPEELAEAVGQEEQTISVPLYAKPGVDEIVGYKTFITTGPDLIDKGTD